MAIHLFKTNFMKSNALKLFLFVAVFGLGFACNNAAEDTDNEGEAMEENMDDMEGDAETAAEPTEIVSTESYTTMMLKDGIASPRKEMTGTIGDAEVTVNYGSPSVKGRTLWGDLVPYGEIWRTGANEATTVTFSEDVMIEGNKLAAGTYGLFTIPGEDEWTVVFSEVTESWGAGDYDEAKDALRVNVSPMMKDEASETMEFMVDGNNLVLRWDKLHLPVAVSTATAG